MPALNELGERQLLKEIIPRFCPEAGDDCAILPVEKGQIVITTDPVPSPAALVIGGDSDPYWRGWLLVTINASDLAAAGAHGGAFLAAIEAPSDYDLALFSRMLEGIASACTAEGLKYIGGNIREGAQLSAVGTAIGYCTNWTSIRRTGAKAGDIIVSVGMGGRFWHDALCIRNGLQVAKESSPVFRPLSQLRAMTELAKKALISAAIDNSDGLIPSIEQLCSANNLSAEVDLTLLRRPIALDHGQVISVSEARLWLGWGDWNVFCAVAPDKVAEVQGTASEFGSTAIVIGKFFSGPKELYLRRNSASIRAPRIESERFALDSWFETGIDGYIDLLLNTEIP